MSVCNVTALSRAARSKYAKEIGLPCTASTSPDSVRSLRRSESRLTPFAELEKRLRESRPIQSIFSTLCSALGQCDTSDTAVRRRVSTAGRDESGLGSLGSDLSACFGVGASSTKKVKKAVHELYHPRPANPRNLPKSCVFIGLRTGVGFKYGFGVTGRDEEPDVDSATLAPS